MQKLKDKKLRSIEQNWWQESMIYPKIEGKKAKIYGTKLRSIQKLRGKKCKNWRAKNLRSMEQSGEQK